VRKGEELKAPRYASAAATRDHITTRDIIPTFLEVDRQRVVPYCLLLKDYSRY
jgi:hypothetical protein